MQNNKTRKTSIGGSALIEGVMMKGPRVSAMAVRKPDGEIKVDTWENSINRPWYKKTPFVRGVFNFIDSMRDSYKCLMQSADISGIEEEPSKFEKWLMDKLGEKFSTVFQLTALVLGMALAIGLFIVAPTSIISFLRPFIKSSLALTAIEAVTKIAIFVGYIFAVSRMSDIRRVFEYHGAEHKTIACYEAFEELTVENVRKHTRFHPRCGTSFMLIVIVVSVLVSSFVSWDNVLIRILLKIICLPLVMGIAYELIKLAGRHNNIFTRIISAPGLWLQRLTTNEPDDMQMEVAIASMRPCIPENEGEDRW